MVIEGLQLT